MSVLSHTGTITQTTYAPPLLLGGTSVRCVTTHLATQKRRTCVYAAFSSSPTSTTRDTGNSFPNSGADKVRWVR